LPPKVSQGLRLIEEWTAMETRLSPTQLDLDRPGSSRMKPIVPDTDEDLELWDHFVRVVHWLREADGHRV
jgi:hypothetical protein